MNSTAPSDTAPRGQGRQLRLGDPIRATEGVFGVLADIIVDPVAGTVTHVAVEPNHRHLQSRLIPIDLVTVDDDALTVALDLEQIRQMPRIAFSEFVPLASAIDIGDEWDIVDQEVLAQPYWGGDVLGMGRPSIEQAQVTFDRIPKGECEIRRDSEVLDDRHKVVGHVEGLLVDEADVSGVVVRTGLAGLHHLVVVPLSAVGSVTNEGIELLLDRHAFDELPHADRNRAPDRTSMPSPLQAQISSFAHHTAKRTRRTIARARSLRRRSTS